MIHILMKICKMALISGFWSVLTLFNVANDISAEIIYSAYGVINKCLINWCWAVRDLLCVYGITLSVYMYMQMK